MKVQVKDQESGFSEFLNDILNSNPPSEIKKEVTEKSTQKEDQIDTFKIKQLEQKQELLVGLTNLLYKKFEEINPTPKYSKFEFTDLSWYKKLETKK